MVITACGIHAAAQQQPQPSPEAVQRILDRLDTLEKQNEGLLKEIHDLRQELADSVKNPTTEERVEAVEQRTAEQAQTKVSASQKFPIELTGMFLFDATKGNGTGYAGAGLGTGASIRQSIIGLNFYGPHIFGDGQIHGSLAMDFYAGNTDSLLRIRRGAVSFDWKRRSITFGQEKPLISPLQPTSFAHVGIPPLAEAGNLWLWLPQVEYEERIPIGPNTTVKAQAEVIQTNETYGIGTNSYVTNFAASRPGFEARVALEHSSNERPLFAVGVGGHVSQTHVLGQSLPSRVVSVDFRYAPKRWFELSGTVLGGENFGNLGGLPGISISEYGPVSVHSSAGWVQLAFPVTSRLTFDLYAGRQLNHATDLETGDPFRSLVYAGNILYRIAPNVVLGFEGGHNELTYLSSVPYSGQRFDATVAYLF